MGKVVVAGVGMIPFAKPGRSKTYLEMGVAASREALRDAGLRYTDIQHAYVGYVYGDSTCGQAALYQLGETGIPIFNVNNNCSSGSTALYLARQAVESGVADCVLALGFEQMNPGATAAVFGDRPSPIAQHEAVIDELLGPDPEAPPAPRLFGAAGDAYAAEYGVDQSVFAEIAVKARRHAINNPHAVFRDLVTVEEVLESPTIYGSLTRLQCCPPTCGAAAAIVCTPEFAANHNVASRVVVRAQALASDSASSFDPDPMKVVGYDMTRLAAEQVYEMSGVAPTDVPVVELHDCFTTNEVLSYEALGLTAPGTAEKFIRDGQNTYGGQVVTNPSGGLLSKGHPLGATGLAQCAELVWQLRGQAGPRQVEGVSLALQHNVGLGGACVVTLYERV